MGIVISSGDPAGIGPDICCRLAAEPNTAAFAVIGDPALFESRAAQLGVNLKLELLDTPAAIPRHEAGRLRLLPLECAVRPLAGKPNTANASYVLEMLSVAARSCMSGEADAMVTAPVQKSVITQAGIPFSGHTEYLAAETGAERAVMLLAAPTMRVALATTHLPLADVPPALNADDLEQLLGIVERDLRVKFGIDAPRLLVLGLNPHAGEDGTLGREEIEIIAPVLDRMRTRGLNVRGPVAADTAFTPESLATCDVVIAMYHDQGLPPLKAHGFGQIVNVTLGLPIIRTSVDHGTALDLAGTGRARHESLGAALALAARLARTG